MDLFDYIAILGLLQAIVVAILIFTNRVFRNKANRHFAFFLLLVAVIGLDARLSQYYARLPPFWELFFDILGDDIPWIMIFYLPLFRFFAEVHDGPLIKIRYWVLSLPFMLFVIINIWIDLDLEFNLISSPLITENRTIFYQMEDYISIILFLTLHGIVYRRLIKSNDSKWLKGLWWYCTVLILMWGVLTIDQSFFEDQFFRSIEIVLWCGIALFIYWLMYAGLFQFNLANNRQEIRAKLGGPMMDTSSKKSTLSVKSKTHYEQLMHLMAEEKAYRNPDLGREIVAEHLGISVSYLTQLVKQYADKNLTGFINDFRVKDAQEMLRDPAFDNYDHLSIGLEAGFKSKSAYYSTFKNLTGLTPAQFKKES